MKFFATILLCSLCVVSICAETKPNMNKDKKLKRESASSYGGSSGYSGGGLSGYNSGGHGGGSSGLSLSYGVPSFGGGSSGGHQQIQLAPISLNMLSGGGGHGGLSLGGGLNLDTSKLSGLSGGGAQGHYILDTSKLTALLGAQGLNFDSSKLLSSGGAGGHGLDLGSYGGGAHSANLISAQALVGGGGDHGASGQSGATQYGYALAPSSGGYGSGGGFSFGNSDKQGPITFGQQNIQSPPAATYGVPTSSYQIPSGSYGTPIQSFGGQGHSFGGSLGSFGNIGSFGSFGGGSTHSAGQDSVPSYAAGIKGLGHYSSSSPFNSLSSSQHFAQLSLPGSKYGTPLFTSGKSYGGSSSGFNFAQQPSISSYRHTSAPTYAGLTSGLKSSGSFRPSVFLGASTHDSGDLSSYTSGGSSSYNVPTKAYLPASSGSYQSGQSYSFPSSSSSSHGSLGSLGSSGASYSFPSSSSHSSLGSLGGGASYSSGSHGNLGSLGGGSSYSYPSSSSSSSSSHGGLGGGSSGDSYGSGSFDGHNNYNTIDYSSQSQH